MSHDIISFLSLYDQPLTGTQKNYFMSTFDGDGATDEVRGMANQHGYGCYKRRVTTSDSECQLPPSKLDDLDYLYNLWGNDSICLESQGGSYMHGVFMKVAKSFDCASMCTGFPSEGILVGMDYSCDTKVCIGKSALTVHHPFSILAIFLSHNCT